MVSHKNISSPLLFPFDKKQGNKQDILESTGHWNKINPFRGSIWSPCQGLFSDNDQLTIHYLLHISLKQSNSLDVHGYICNITFHVSVKAPTLPQQ